MLFGALLWCKQVAAMGEINKWEKTNEAPWHMPFAGAVIAAVLKAAPTPAQSSKRLGTIFGPAAGIMLSLARHQKERRW
jgi:hypothetical protein